MRGGILQNEGALRPDVPIATHFVVEFLILQVICSSSNESLFVSSIDEEFSGTVSIWEKMENVYNEISIYVFVIIFSVNV